MRTVHEEAWDGTITVFHRRGNEAWTHAPGVRYTDKTTGREYACRCAGPKRGRPRRTPAQALERAQKDRERKRTVRGKIAENHPA